MSFAIIQLQGKQYQISEGDELVVDHLETPVGDSLSISDVLLVNQAKTVKIGTPLVKNAQVKLTVLEQGKGEKIRVVKYKAKSRYRKVRGHRQHLTKLKVVKISA